VDAAARLHLPAGSYLRLLHARGLNLAMVGEYFWVPFALGALDISLADGFRALDGSRLAAG
jgi:hypothetical protein